MIDNPRLIVTEFMQNIFHLHKARESDIFCPESGHECLPGHDVADAMLWTRFRPICYEVVLLAVFYLSDKKYPLIRETRGCGLIHCRCGHDSLPCQGHGRLDAGRQLLLRESEIVDWRAGVCSYCLLFLILRFSSNIGSKDTVRSPSTALPIRCSLYCVHIFGMPYHCIALSEST